MEPPGAGTRHRGELTVGEAQRTLLAARVARTRISASAVAAQRARELRAAGVDIIELAQGEPDFNART